MEIRRELDLNPDELALVAFNDEIYLFSVAIGAQPCRLGGVGQLVLLHETA